MYHENESVEHESSLFIPFLLLLIETLLTFLMKLTVHTHIPIEAILTTLWTPYDQMHHEGMFKLG